MDGSPYCGSSFPVSIRICTERGVAASSTAAAAAANSAASSKGKAKSGKAVLSKAAGQERDDGVLLASPVAANGGKQEASDAAV